MRRLIYALVIYISVGVSVGVACHHDPAPATPADPADKPPLPPASGTPIGFLIDDAGELKLSDLQLSKLRELDTSLAADLEKIDAATRSANRPADSDSTPPPSSGRHGGRHGGGGMGGAGASGGGHHKHQGSGSGSPSTQASLGKLSDERQADVKDALTHAFALLDDNQQALAKKVLADHDVDLDVAPTASVKPPTLQPPSSSDGNTESDPPPEP